MRRTRRFKRSTQKGGSVPFLNAEQMGYPTPESLEAQMDLYAIACHGETTDDTVFFVVPPRTYCMFATHSGEYAPGNDPAESSFVSYTGDKKTYYPKLYAQLFQSHAQRKAYGPLYRESLYIYQPGDVIPDYTLTFQNTLVFMFRHGIYKLPIEALSGTNTPQYLYLGKPLKVIKQALLEGKLTESDLAELSEADKDAIHSKTLDELNREGIPSTKQFTRTRLFDKLESLCCRGPDNLLFTSGLNIEQLQSYGYKIRLSTVLQALPKDPTKRDRFFFLNFCRVSYSDIGETYKASNSKELKLPSLLRTLSFGAKCGGEYGTDAAFNILDVVQRFCTLSVPQKKALLQHPSMRKCIAILKLGSGLPFSVWTDCLKGTYQILGTLNRAELVANYRGYFTLDDLLFLSHMYTELLRLKDIDSATADACNQLLPPFKTLYVQLEKQTLEFEQFMQKKKQLITDFYAALQNRMKGILLPKRDFLYLGSSSVEEIQDVLRNIQQGLFDGDIEILEDRYADEDLTRSNIQGELREVFQGYLGAPFSASETEQFPNVGYVNTSIGFENLWNEPYPNEQEEEPTRPAPQALPSPAPHVQEPVLNATEALLRQFEEEARQKKAKKLAAKAAKAAAKPATRKTHRRARKPSYV